MILLGNSAGTDIGISPFSQLVPQVGRIFTPIHLAEWCLEKYKVFEAWQEGASILDPACGQGAFFEAFLSIAEKRKILVQEKDLRRLYGVEIIPADKLNCIRKIRQKYGLEFPEENFTTGDFISFLENKKFDYTIGNPPWINFTDLPEWYKTQVKSAFVKYGIVKDSKKVLLGKSRADLAGLIIKKCADQHLKPDGVGLFFIPLSLFFNDGANEEFIPAQNRENAFSVEEISDFSGQQLFSGVSTRHGLVKIRKSARQKFPVPLYVSTANGEQKRYCHPVSENGGAWLQSDSYSVSQKQLSIPIHEYQLPRQGINTGGLNKVFIFARNITESSNIPSLAVFKNGFSEEVMLPGKYMYPLLHTGLFGGNTPRTQKYVLCLHKKDGAVFSWPDFHHENSVCEYLERYRLFMQGRKGTLIQNQIAKGKYWALFGVGPYSFMPWKVVWESMGRREFKAIVVGERWQGNQAMHAISGCRTRSEAESLCARLNSTLPGYLKSFGMAGTCNWAQPGRVRRVMEITPGPSRH